ncbi:MAG: hypothetical protein JWN43_3602 [Gammaproteobacteria bacterium]|nr:hypothetical protein [Gammaproteobacteria bacterium]
MHLPLRRFLIVAVLVAIGGFATAVNGCVSKPPQPEPATDAATPTPTPKPQPTPAGTGTSPGAPASASAGASGAIETSTGTGPSASASASAGPASGSAVPVGRAQTADERRAALDKRLNDSLGSFDAQLRKEQERLARERDARQTTVTTVTAVDGGAKSTPDENGEAAENPATEPSHKPTASHRGGAAESRSARAGDLKSDKSAAGANGNASGNGAVAEEIPDGNDDDIVARRLRKAAEQETDPELKDKLWKEYVEYKKNTQGK